MDTEARRPRRVVESFRPVEKPENRDLGADGLTAGQAVV
jgi:hypothetical protein